MEILGQNTKHVTVLQDQIYTCTEKIKIKKNLYIYMAVVVCVRPSIRSIDGFFFIGEAMMSWEIII